MSEYIKKMKVKYADMRRLPIITIILIGIVYCVMPLFISRLGDDITYSKALNGGFAAWWEAHMPDHYGRLIDLTIAPFVLQLSPLHKISYCLLNGIFFSLFFWLLTRLSSFRQNNVAGRMILLSIAVFALGWEFIWNEVLLFVNYVWAAAIILGAIYLACYAHIKTWIGWCLIPLCLFAGASHDATSVMMIAAVPMLFIFSPAARHYKPVQIAMLVAIWLGSVYTLSCPSYYYETNRLRMFSIFELLFVSAWPQILLLVTIVMMGIWRRRLLNTLIDTPWTMFMVGAVMSIPLLIFSGYPGRPAWFGQIFALVALTQISAYADIQLSKFWLKTISILLFGVILCHYAVTLYWQYRLNMETRQLITQFETAPHGTVYLDYTTYDEVPWYVMNHVKGVPDADGVYSRRKFGYAYRYGDALPLSIAPTAMQSWTIDSVSTPVHIGRHIVSGQPLPGAYYMRNNYMPLPVADIPNELGDTSTYVQSPIPAQSHRPGPYNAPVLYLYSPLDLHPGSWF